MRSLSRMRMFQPFKLSYYTSKIRKETASMLRWLEKEATDRKNIMEHSISFDIDKDNIKFRIQKKIPLQSIPGQTFPRHDYEDEVLTLTTKFIQISNEIDSELNHYAFNWLEHREAKKLLKRVFANYTELHLTNFFEFTERYKSPVDNNLRKQDE